MIFFSLFKSDISLRIGKFVTYTTNCWNKNFLHDSFFLKKTYASISRKLAKLVSSCRSINFFHGWYLLNVRYFCINKLLIPWKNSEIRDELSKYDLFSWLTFLKYTIFFFFCTNIFQQKICKFVIYMTNCWNINFDDMEWLWRDTD